MKDRIKKAFADHRKMLEGLSSQIVDDIEKGAQSISRVLEQGNKILIMGNGGSAADAQHMAAEFVGRFLHERRALPAVALTTDTSILTALGNDYGYEKIFERQIEALAKKGDLVIGISTSGKSDNVMIALERAIELGCTTMGLTGELGGPIAKIVDLNLYVPSKDTPRIQEGHVMIIHILCDLVEQNVL